ncbi:MULTISPECIES: DinB family protein [Bradyrhizobium]|uniref:DinB family protein n=1 Tax=Bradyrhizobium TaxID=374 RepID=UPI00230436F0|nr:MULTISPECIES: DinB family protein [Bradyrhizobium]MDA9544107.1 damage-inducible protein DinB [Bradyrhizobium sp. CCBAU 45321]MDF0578539.1 DinB family protein [Bradyrhizobium yuanmingense]
MISADYCRLMARYNTWQNASLVTTADGLTHEDRWKDRGAFFRSIAATLNHLYWADALILERLKGNARPEETIKHSLTSPSDWDAFKALRLQRNEEIEAWSARLRDADLNGMLVWYPGDGSTRIEKPKTLVAIQLFNHQTHHRGQVHAMLTAAGADPEPTDIHLLA